MDEVKNHLIFCRNERDPSVSVKNVPKKKSASPRYDC